MAKRRKKLKVRSNGRLNKAVGGKASKNRSKVRKLAKGKGITAKRARFYLNVLSKRRKR